MVPDHGVETSLPSTKTIRTTEEDLFPLVQIPY